MAFDDVCGILKGQGLKVRCPACQQNHAISQGQLRRDFTCPTPECGLHLKLNQFLVANRWKEATPPAQVDDFQMEG
jgi:hypothetical protein